MAHIVVLGAAAGDMPAAYELKELLGKNHEITVINEREYFQFVPSNPWLCVGWRDRDAISFDIRKYLERKKINFITKRCEKISPDENYLTVDGGERIDFDYLVIATGPRLAFEEVKGSGPDGGFTHSVCSVDRAEKAYEGYKRLLEKPGHLVVGAMPFASCFGPAYEAAFVIDADLRKRKIRDQVPMTYVTSEPYIGHLGLGGVGDSKSVLESELRQHHIKWICNAKVTRVEEGKMFIDEYSDTGEVVKQHELEFDYSMMLPAFKGVDAVANVEGRCNPRGLVHVDEFQRNPTWSNIYSARVVHCDPADRAHAGAYRCAKIGYMLESMVTAITHNIANYIAGKAPDTRATWNALCLADMGYTGCGTAAKSAAQCCLDQEG
jgi:sulfide:quinone oxidoreductase